MAQRSYIKWDHDYNNDSVVQWWADWLVVSWFGGWIDFGAFIVDFVVACFVCFVWCMCVPLVYLFVYNFSVVVNLLELYGL